MIAIKVINVKKKKKDLPPLKVNSPIKQEAEAFSSVIEASREDTTQSKKSLSSRK